MPGTLYTWAGNPRAQAVQACGDVKVADFVPGTAPAGFPAHATAPVFECDNGDKLTQWSAILAAVSGSSDAKSLEWISFAENVIGPCASAWVYPTLGAMPNNKGAINEGKQALLLALAYLNEALSTRTFLVGDRVSAADAANVAALVLAFKQVLADNYRQNIPHVVRWFNTCINQPSFSSFGQVNMAAKEAVFDGKTFGAMNKSSGGDKKVVKKEAPKKKAAAAPKPAPAAVEAPKKKEDPWAGLPGTFDMDAWKRCYSNNDVIPTSMDYFWKHLEAEHYSIWFGKYKYGDEINMPFMASNLIRGFFQRIDKMRKNSFASMCVFGGETKGDLEISGVWFMKGQGLCFELSPDWQVDWDTYDWKKLDPVADKKMITEYFAWEGDFDGKKFYEGKIWK